MDDVFSQRHPAVNFTFFAAMLLLSMLGMHPALLTAMVFASATYAVSLSARDAVKMLLRFCLPVFLIWLAVNPLFNRQGENVLLYMNDRPFMTYESLVYGAVSGARFVCIMLWFFCYNRVMTTDKFLFLFGRIVPSAALLLSMALRFIPRYSSQARRIADARRGIGRHVDEGKLAVRVRSGAGVLFALTTWAVENSMETADSMNSRGYGTAARTRFSVYRMTSADLAAFAIFAAALVTVVLASAAGMLDAYYFPVIEIHGTGVYGHLFFIFITLFALFPVILNGWEAVRWRVLLSKI